MADFEFTVVDVKKWDTLPLPAPPKKPDRYEKILDALEQGQIIRLSATGDSDLKGKRIGIGRRSRARGFVTEFRIENGYLYARKSDQDIQPKAPKERKKKEPTTA